MLLAGSRYQAPFGQSSFAFARGLRFEEIVRERHYAPLIDLLRDKLGFQLTNVKIGDLRGRFAPNDEGMHLRAHETRTLIADIPAAGRARPRGRIAFG